MSIETVGEVPHVNRPPRAVAAGLSTIGEHVRTWRRLQGVPAAELAERAGVSLATLRRLEAGKGATLENFLRVVRIIPILDDVVAATDPWNNDRGRALMDNRIARGRRPS